MIFYTRLKCRWHARKDGWRNYPAAGDPNRPEFEGELYRACRQWLSTLAMNWQKREKQVEAIGLPNLKGVTVCVARARAKNSVQSLRIRAFWVQYLKVCGAVIDKADYGRAFIGISG